MESLTNMSNGQQHVQRRAGPLGFEFPVLIDGGARVKTGVSRQLECMARAESALHDVWARCACAWHQGSVYILRNAHHTAE
jgi:hypothetical protein